MLDGDTARKLQAAAQLICRSRRPIILAGSGIHSEGVQRRLRRVAELADLPIVATPGASESIGSRHPLLLGGAGQLASDIAVAALSRADVVVVLGGAAELQEKEADMLIGGGAKVIRLKPVSWRAGVEKDDVVELQGELKHLLTCLENLLLPVRHPSWIRELRQVGGR